MSEQEQPVAFVRDPMSFAGQQPLGEATSQIQYVSLGHCLVIGESAHALNVAQPLASSGFTIVQIDTNVARVDKQLTESGIAVFTVPQLDLAGHLGAYTARVSDPADARGAPFDLGVATFRETGCFDLVLDLSETALMPMLLPPFGYFHATTDEAIAQALEELVTLRGDFEKPRYFNYDSRICAHSRSELKGCQRCVDVCVTGAITSFGEGISVDPFLCQGCGSCATLCPSGAMTYAYPRPGDAINRTRDALKAQSTNTVVLHTEAQQTSLDAMSLPASVTTLVVEEVSAFGADFWLTLLAGPAERLILLLDAAPEDPNRQAVQSQIQWVEPLMAALGVEGMPISTVRTDQLADHLAQVADVGPGVLSAIAPHDFATHNDKRQTIRLALDALFKELQPDSITVDLPSHAPFGRIEVDTRACTLCMACVSTCPAKALLDGQDTPALRFVEANCLQCGLCEKACPETAISLRPQYTWDSVEARRVDTLHEETPFHCVRCHTAFTTQAMIDTMTDKLAGHWMFQDEKAVRRLKLCGDCRVRDMFEEDAGGIAVHREES